MSGTLSPNFSLIQRLFNWETRSERDWSEKGCSKRTIFFLSFSLVESSLKNLSYVLMSFKDNTNEQLIILSIPSSIYRVVLFVTKPKPTTNRITIPILFLIELETNNKENNSNLFPSRIRPWAFGWNMGNSPIALSHFVGNLFFEPCLNYFKYTKLLWGVKYIG